LNVVHDEVLEVASEQRIGHGGEAETSVLMAIALTPFEPIILYRPTQDLGLSLKYFELIIRMSIVQMDTPMMHRQQARRKEKLVEAAVKECVSAIEDFITFKPVGTRTHPGKHQYPKP